MQKGQGFVISLCACVHNKRWILHNEPKSNLHLLLLQGEKSCSTRHPPFPKVQKRPGTAADDRVWASSQPQCPSQVTVTVNPLPADWISTFQLETMKPWLWDILGLMLILMLTKGDQSQWASPTCSDFGRRHRFQCFPSTRCIDFSVNGAPCPVDWGHGGFQESMKNYETCKQCKKKRTALKVQYSYDITRTSVVACD
eukprot:s923_g22.t1